MPRCSLCELLVCELDGLVKGFLGGLLALHGEGDLLLEVLGAVVVGELGRTRAVAVLDLVERDLQSLALKGAFVDALVVVVIQTPLADGNTEAFLSNSIWFFSLVTNRAKSMATSGCFELALMPSIS